MANTELSGQGQTNQVEKKNIPTLYLSDTHKPILIKPGGSYPLYTGRGLSRSEFIRLGMPFEDRKPWLGGVHLVGKEAGVKQIELWEVLVDLFNSPRTLLDEIKPVVGFREVELTKEALDNLAAKKKEAIDDYMVDDKAVVAVTELSRRGDRIVPISSTSAIIADAYREKLSTDYTANNNPTIWSQVDNPMPAALAFRGIASSLKFKMHALRLAEDVAVASGHNLVVIDDDGAVLEFGSYLSESRFLYPGSYGELSAQSYPRVPEEWGVKRLGTIEEQRTLYDEAFHGTKWSAYLRKIPSTEIFIL